MSDDVKAAIADAPGFHLGFCRPDRDDRPAGPGCHEDCPRRLHAEVERLRRSNTSIGRRNLELVDDRDRYREALVDIKAEHDKVLPTVTSLAYRMVRIAEKALDGEERE